MRRGAPRAKKYRRELKPINRGRERNQRGRLRRLSKPLEAQIKASFLRLFAADAADLGEEIKAAEVVGRPGRRLPLQKIIEQPRTKSNSYKQRRRSTVAHGRKLAEVGLERAPLASFGLGEGL